MAADIVERIYEAAALPELWPEVFDEISRAHNFVGAGMFTMNAQFQRGVCSDSVRPLLNEFLRDGWQLRNPRAPRVSALNHPGFLRDHEFLTEEEIATEPLYVELLRPHGVGLGAGSVVNCPNGDSVAFSFESDYRLGPVPDETIAELDRLRPHLARAALFSGRLDLERSQAQVAALAAVGLPAAVVTQTGVALAANDEFVGLSSQISIGARDVVSLKNSGAQQLLERTLLSPPTVVGAGRSIPLKAVEDTPPVVFHILPVRRSARDVFSQAAWLLVATPLGAQNAPSTAILSGLFDLTPAEARVARGLIEGLTVAELAAAHGLAESTVRNQLRAVFEKTGATRQSDFVLMCGGIGLAGSR